VLAFLLVKMWVHPGKIEVAALFFGEVSFGWGRVSGGRGRGRALF